MTQKISPRLTSKLTSATPMTQLYSSSASSLPIPLVRICSNVSSATSPKIFHTP